MYTVQMKSLVQKFLRRFLFQIGIKRKIHNLTTSVNITNFEVVDAAFKKIELALNLIAHYSPEKYRALQKDIATIFVVGGFTAFGRYWRELKMVELRESYVTDPMTTPQEIACCLIHEAQHGRIYRLGFSYEKSVRTRVERICMTAERNFARRLPESEALVAYLQNRIEFDWEPYLSSTTNWEAELEAVLNSMKDHGTPSWMMKITNWSVRHRARNISDDG